MCLLDFPDTFGKLVIVKNENNLLHFFYLDKKMTYLPLIQELHYVI